MTYSHYRPVMSSASIALIAPTIKSVTSGYPQWKAIYNALPAGDPNPL